MLNKLLFNRPQWYLITLRSFVCGHFGSILGKEKAVLSFYFVINNVIIGLIMKIRKKCVQGKSALSTGWGS